MSSTVADLMRSNLLDVFNEPDPERRSAAIARTYAEDVVWHEPDRVHRGREAPSSPFSVNCPRNCGTERILRGRSRAF